MNLSDLRKHDTVIGIDEAHGLRREICNIGTTHTTFFNAPMLANSAVERWLRLPQYVVERKGEIIHPPIELT